MEDLKVSTSFVASLFGVSPQAVNSWVRDKACPKLGHGLFDCKAVLEWWLDNIHGGSTPETEDAKERYWLAKAEHEEIKVATLKGGLMPKSEIIPEWSARMAEVTTGLQALARRLPPMLDGKSKTEQQIIVEDQVWKLRDNYCRSGRFTPPQIDYRKIAEEVLGERER